MLLNSWPTRVLSTPHNGKAVEVAGGPRTLFTRVNTRNREVTSLGWMLNVCKCVDFIKMNVRVIVYLLWNNLVSEASARVRFVTVMPNTCHPLFSFFFFVHKTRSYNCYNCSEWVKVIIAVMGQKIKKHKWDCIHNLYVLLTQ
jgi:hypothetical protein